MRLLCVTVAVSIAVSTTAATSAANGTACPVLEKDAEIPGYDYLTIQGIDLETCCTECNANRACGAFSFRPFTSSPGGRCQLKNGYDDSRWDSEGTVTGLKVNMTPEPPTESPITPPPTTKPPTTRPPTTKPPTTRPPTTKPPTSPPPTTQPPTTQPPSTQPPTTEPPSTQPPTTEPPMTQPPTSEPSTTEPPTTEPPTTQPPTTQPPTTQPPTTEPPTTQPPTTQPPTTQPPTTQPPTTEPPTTQPPTTQPPTTQPPPPTSSCPVIEANTDYYGNDITSVTNVNQEACCDACNNNPSCGAFTFVPSSSSSTIGACYLKSSSAGRKTVAGAYSGVKISKSCPRIEVNVDYYGNDLSSVTNIDQAACCSTCKNTAGCKAFTYVPYAAPSTVGACYLKTSDVGRKVVVGAYSGVVGQVTPVPTTTVPTTPAPICPRIEANVDYYGNDLRTVSNVDQTGCCSACNNDASCKAFSFVPSTSSCYLKTTDAGRVAASGVNSGVKGRF